MRNTVPLGVAAILVCPAIALDQADPVTSEYLKTAGGGTAVDTKDGARFAFFGIVLKTVKPLPPNAVLVAYFDNPREPSKPLTTEYTPREGEAEIVIRSEPYTCVVNNRDYRVTVKIYSPDKSTLVSEHIQPISFNMPKKQLQQLRLKECDS